MENTTTAERLPNFDRHAKAPLIAPKMSGIAISIERASMPWRSIVHGAFRVRQEDRDRFPPPPYRHRIWLLGIARHLAEPWLARAGAEALLFPGEEPAEGTVDGWFNVPLGECLELPRELRGKIDVTAILGPLKSPAVEIEL